MVGTVQYSIVVYVCVQALMLPQVVYVLYCAVLCCAVLGWAVLCAGTRSWDKESRARSWGV